MSRTATSDQTIKKVLSRVRRADRPSDAVIAKELGLKMSLVQAVRRAGSLPEWKRRWAIKKDQAVVTKLAQDKLEEAALGKRARPELVTIKAGEIKNVPGGRVVNSASKITEKRPRDTTPQDDLLAQLRASTADSAKIEELSLSLLNDTYKEQLAKQAAIDRKLDQILTLVGEINKQNKLVDEELSVPEVFKRPTAAQSRAINEPTVKSGIRKLFPGGKR